MSDPKQVAQTQRLLQALQKAKQKIQLLEQGRKEPIAIVGMACRFPGESHSPESFWQLLSEGRDAITEVPGNRWDIDQYYHPDPQQPGKMYTRGGGFISDVDKFDANFFGIAPREAIKMDPQHRLLLEVSWQALENAHINPQNLRGSQTGVFVGIGTNDYAQRMYAQDEDFIDAYIGIGNSFSAVPGRLSYLLGLQGPSMAIDTACSSSLVALHLACHSLKQGESQLAIVGGVNLIFSPLTTINFCKARMLAPDCRCKTFDARADGYVRGEGCGVVVLKKLSAAQQDGDHILALVRSTAVNQDGKSGGFTAPNGPAQEALIQEALTKAQLTPGQIDYVEAHGTGTQLGDPIEVGALQKVFVPARANDHPLLLGSVKTNIGHLESAAGVAGLIKTVLALHHGKVPAHLHLQQPNPHIDWDNLPLKIPTQTVDWPHKPDGQPRLASISSFGFVGTNAHAILEEAPQVSPTPAEAKRPWQLLCVSAKGEKALTERLEQVQKFVADKPEVDLENLCYTLHRCAEHSHRCAFVFENRESLQTEISKALAREEVGKEFTGKKTKTAFLFTGQGSQYPGMAQELYNTSLVFRNHLDKCDQILQPLLGQSLVKLLYQDSSELVHQTAYTQPALFAIEYALAQLWLSWGVRPKAVMGHSIGEYPAACLAGVFSLEDGLTLIAQRGALMQKLERPGSMAAVRASEATLQPFLENYQDRVAIAAYNGPKNTVISGDQVALAEILKQLAAAGIRNTPLQVSHAFHSPLMEEMLAEFLQVAQKISYQEPKIPVISNLTGRAVKKGEITQAEYWTTHIRQAVRFAPSMQFLQEQNFTTFVEIGPQPTLITMGQQCFSEPFGSWLPSLRRKKPDWRQLLTSLGMLFLEGQKVNWDNFHHGYATDTIAFPSYPFQRESYWIAASQPQHRVAKRSSLPLVAAFQTTPLAAGYFAQVEVSLETFPWLEEHQVHGQVVVPAAFYWEALYQASQELKLPQGYLRDITIHQPLLLQEQHSYDLQIVWQEHSQRWQIFSQAHGENTWHLHVEALWNRELPQAPELTPPAFTGKEIVPGEAYKQLAEMGLQYGESFQGITEIHYQDGEAWAQVKLPASLEAEAKAYSLHPTLLDAALQVAAAVVGEQQAQEVYIPLSVTSYVYYGKPCQELISHFRLSQQPGSNEESFTGEFALFSPQGELVAEITGFQMKKVPLAVWHKQGEQAFLPWLYQGVWREQVNLPSVEQQERNWLLFVPQESWPAGLAEIKGQQTFVYPGQQRRQLSDHEFAIHPGRSEDYLWLWQQLPAERAMDIVHLWSQEVQQDLPEEWQEETGVISLWRIVVSLQQQSQVVANRLYAVTQGAQAVRDHDALPGIFHSPMWGLGRTISQEHPDLNYVQVDLDPYLGHRETLKQLAQELQRDDQENQIAWRDQKRYLLRLASYHSKEQRIPEGSYFLAINKRGSLDNMEMVIHEVPDPQPDEIQIEVCTTGLNFRDVMNVLGMYPGDPGPLGSECAGIVKQVGAAVTEFQEGDAVMAIAPASFSRFVNTKAAWAALKPKELNWAEAATIPITFLTVAYGFHEVAKITSQDRILIHSGAGGVGLAAIAMARKVGAEIFATAGSIAKREYLRSLGVEHVFDSRSSDFYEHIQQITKGQGVRVVLNSLTGEALQKSLDLVVKDGHFLEIGKAEIFSPEEIRASHQIHYQAFDLGAICQQQPALISKMFGALVQDLQTGALRPLRYRQFLFSQVRQAFRYMAQARHIGKIIVRHRAAHSALRGDGCYLITGGLGALGLEMAELLIAKGAKSLVLTGRSAPRSEAKAKITDWRHQGVKVSVVQADVSKEADVVRLFALMEKELPPLKGLIHAAGVLDDGVLTKQTPERFHNVLAPKVQGAWLLHRMSADKQLDFFYLFSSAASLMGTPGQGNYAAANAFLDALAHYRNAQGLPAMAINWGAWQIGMAEGKDQPNVGLEPIPLEMGKEIFQWLLPRDLQQLMVLPIQWEKVKQQIPVGSEPPFFREIYRQWSSQQVATGKAASSDSSDIKEALKRAVPEKRKTVLCKHLQERISQVLGISQDKRIEVWQGFFDLGMDSLTALETRNILQQDFGPLPTSVFFDYPNIDALAGYLLEEVLEFSSQPKTSSATNKKAEEVKTVAPEEEDDSELDNLSEDELLGLITDTINDLNKRKP